MRGMPTLDRAFLPSDLEAAVAGTPGDATIAVQATSTVAETDWLLDCGERNSLIEGAVGWVDLAHEGTEERLAQLLSRGSLLRGIRHQVHDESDSEWLLRAPVLAGLGAVANAGLAAAGRLPRRVPVH